MILCGSNIPEGRVPGQTVDPLVLIMNLMRHLLCASLNLLVKSKTCVLQKIYYSKRGPQFNFIRPEATVLEAITIMKSENISYLIVRDNDNRYHGIISERDYTHKVILANKHSDSTQVKDIMTDRLTHGTAR
jgi:signal-transduction protein with cAMP-binding, CBS, and nucleotidyltransferase domain